MTKFKSMISGIKENPLYIIIFVLPFIYGGFHEFVSCILSVLLLTWIIILCKKGSLNIPSNISFFAVLSVPVFYLISAFWAVDSGMAFIGFIKYLPLPLFALLTVNCAEEKRQKCIKAIPYSAACMTVISFILSFIPITKGYITVSGRLGGFFEYPNTFALFLLLGLIVLGFEGSGEEQGGDKKEKVRSNQSQKAKNTSKGSVIISVITALILLFGIFQSGSRTVFVLLIASAVIAALFSKSKAVRKITLIMVPSAIALAVIIALITNNFSSIGRFLTSSITESTFVGRILYCIDVIPQILSHPFGRGYGSYIYLQGSFQTGVYSVKFIHNDFLQLFFETGWLPPLLLIAAALYSFFKKGNKKTGKRLMLAVIFIHGMLDFSLQYMEIFFIFLLLLDYGKARTVSIKNNAKKAIWGTGGAAAAMCLYFGAACFFEFLGSYTISTALYPFYTEGYVYLMLEEQELETAKQYSDKVKELNQSVYQAYLIQSAYDFKNGDVLSATQNKEKAISLSPYTLSSYTEYIDMLNIAFTMYTRAGDQASAEYCRKKIVSVPALLQKVKNRTSSLGLMIDDKPQLELPREYIEIIDGMSRQK